MEEVKIVYRDQPLHNLRFSDEDRREAVTVTVPTIKGNIGEDRCALPANCVVEAARRQLRLGNASLQLSLQGVVLSPQQDVLQFLEGLSAGTRNRLIFLLFPGNVEDVGEKSMGKTRRIRFAEESLMPPEEVVTSIGQEGGKVDFQPKCSQIDVRRETPSSLCVFRESWLNPHLCVRCHRVRGMHRVFSPTKQERINGGITLASKRTTTSLRSLQSPMGQSAPPKLVLPYYYADPQQWKPQRDERYKSRVKSCQQFLQAWGNPTLCARCHGVKSAHRPEATKRLSTPRPTTTPTRQLRSLSSSGNSGRASSPGYARRTCPHINSLSNGEYCTTCYTQRVTQMMQKQALCSPLVSVNPRRRQRTPLVQPKPQTAPDWLDISTCGDSVLTLKGDNDSSHKLTTGAVGQLWHKNGEKAVAAVSAQTESSFILSSSSFYSTPLSMGSRLSKQNTRSTFPYEIPWDVVLRYASMEELLTCMGVSRILFFAAIPLIYENCKYIIQFLDVPDQKRELLVQNANFYASVIVDVMQQKNPCCRPIKAATHPLRFFHYCVLQLFEAAQAVECGGGKKALTKNIQKRQYALMMSSENSASVLLTDIAVGVALGRTVNGEEFNLSTLTHTDKVRDAIEFFIKNVAWCDPASLSQDATQCISEAFESISVAAAASLVCFTSEESLKVENGWTRHTNFLSLGDFFEKYALMPLVDFLQSVEVVARMKRRARRCLEGLQFHRRHHRLYCSTEG